MIVLDASVVVELLTNGTLADSLRSDLANRDDSFIVPHLLDIEVVSAIRRLVAGRRIDSHRSGELLTELAMLPAERYAHTLSGHVANAAPRTPPVVAQPAPMTPVTSPSNSCSQPCSKSSR